jgi:hypothetical protein
MLPAPVTRSSWHCVQSVLCWRAFPLASALRSTGSAADRSALFIGFPATMASSDFPRPCIIGYGSSPSRCGPPASAGDGQTRDIPSSDPILPRVMCSLTPAGCPLPSHSGTGHVAFDHEHGLRPREMPISWLAHTPHAVAVYASCPTLPPVYATLATRRLARPYLCRTCTGRSRQLSWRLRSCGLRLLLIPCAPGCSRSRAARGQGSRTYRHMTLRQSTPRCARC